MSHPDAILHGRGMGTLFTVSKDSFILLRATSDQESSDLFPKKVKKYDEKVSEGGGFNQFLQFVNNEIDSPVPVIPPPPATTTKTTTSGGAEKSRRAVVAFGSGGDDNHGAPSLPSRGCCSVRCESKSEVGMRPLGFSFATLQNLK